VTWHQVVAWMILPALLRTVARTSVRLSRISRRAVADFGTALWFLLAWLAIGPPMGATVSFVTGEAIIQEIILATGGGLVSGGVYALRDGKDGSLTTLCVIAGAAAFILFGDFFAIVW